MRFWLINETGQLQFDGIKLEIKDIVLQMRLSFLWSRRAKNAC